MKTTFCLGSIACILLIAGTASGHHGTRSARNTLPAIEISPAIKALPVVADLSVSETRVRGEASGKIEEGIESLQRQAIANALGHNPPSITAPDVLIGTTFFYTQEGHNLDVVATGYPAFFTNFRSAQEGDVNFLSVHTASRNENLNSTSSSSYRGMRITGIVLTSTVYGAPIGVPLIIIANRKSRSR